MLSLEAHLPNSISKKRLQSQESADGPSLLGEAADGYEKDESSEYPGSDGDLSDVGSSPIAGEQSWDGIRASNVGETAQLSTSGSRTHKPPTGAEITAIKAAQDLFMSSSFKFQVSLVVLLCLTLPHFHEHPDRCSSTKRSAKRFTQTTDRQTPLFSSRISLISSVHRTYPPFGSFESSFRDFILV